MTNQALRPIALAVLATSARKSDFLSVGIELLAVSRHRKSRNPNQGMLGWRVHTQIAKVVSHCGLVAWKQGGDVERRKGRSRIKKKSIFA